MKKICSDCVEKRKMNCFICGMERACTTCLDLISDKKLYSAEIIELKKNRQMLLWFEVEYIPRQNSIDFESAKEISMEVDKRIIESRRFEMVKTMSESKSCMRNEEFSQNIVMFVYGLKHIKTKNVELYIYYSGVGRMNRMKMINYTTYGLILS